MTCQFDLTDMEFRMIRDFIHEKSGLYFNEEKRSFLRIKLCQRLISLGLDSFLDYYYHLKYTKDDGKELSRMLSLITNNETYFFRELPQLTVFRDIVLPEIRERKIASNQRELTVVSAGCSTGEEAYTLAMLIFETGGFFWDWNVKVIGLDIDDGALEVAAEGKYSDRSLRMTEQANNERYFSKNSGDYKVKDNIIKITSFRKQNIVNPTTWDEINNIDVLFCRNVLIYFSEEKMRDTVGYFYKALRNGGYLFLGHSESLSSMPSDFKPRRFPETIGYLKSEK
jgi:chemotaxis protein methyltransferase CheR